MTTSMDTKNQRGGQPVQRHTSLEDLTQRNIDTIAALELAMRDERTASDRVADSIAGFCGSMTFVWVHVVSFGLWMVINTVPGIRHIDPLPFSFLTLVVSLEAIFLTTFVLISQNHQGRTAERRNHLDLQINLLAEQETSKILDMLGTIMQHMGIKPDHDAATLQEATRPETLVKQIGQTMEGQSNASKSSDGADAR